MVGNLVPLQCIDIPVGIDPTPFWANLCLFDCEDCFISNLIKSDKPRAIKFKNTSRFNDDECNFIDSGKLSESFHELQLKYEYHGLLVTFHDLNINVADGIYEYKLDDKKCKHPVNNARTPDPSGNIHAYIFHGSILSEFFRITKSLN